MVTLDKLNDKTEQHVTFFLVLPSSLLKLIKNLILPFGQS